LDMFDEIRGSDLTVPAATMSMILALGSRAACRGTGTFMARSAICY